MRFGKTTRTAYLPDNDEGHDLLKRLEYAFAHGLTFEVATSFTTGLANVVTWSTIPHKTYWGGGPPDGFPDPLYFMHCNDALDALGVPPANEL